MNEHTKRLIKGFGKLIFKGYLHLNRGLLFFWRKLVEKRPESRWTIAVRTLIDNSATALFLNTIILVGIALVFDGFISDLTILLIIFNVLVFCFRIVWFRGK